MNRLVLACAAILSLAVGCGGGGGGGGGGSLESRCANTCDKRNADPECEPGSDINCPATCASLIANANATSCTTELDALFTCMNAMDICTAGGGFTCNTENTLLIQCQAGDAGP